jgi:hypothetical protein
VLRIEPELFFRIRLVINGISSPSTGSKSFRYFLKNSLSNTSDTLKYFSSAVLAWQMLAVQSLDEKKFESARIRLYRMMRT